MRCQRLVIAVFLGILGLATACSGKAGAIELQLRLKKDDSFGFKVSTDQKIMQTMKGKEQETSQRTKMEYTMDVKDVDGAGNASTTVTYDRIVIEQESLLGKVEYDSSNPPASASSLASSYGAMAGKSISIRFSAKGKVLEVRGLDAILEEMLNEMDLPAAEVGAAREQMKAQFGDEAAVEMMREIMLNCPDRPIRVGETWTQEVTLTKGFAMILKNTYTLKGRDGGLLEVDIRSEVRSNPAGKPMDMGGVSVRHQVSGEQEGTMRIQEETGMILNSSLRQKISGEMVLEGPKGGAAGMRIPIEMESTTEMESFVKK